MERPAFAKGAFMGPERHRPPLRPFGRLAIDESAATAIEYALIAVGIAGVIIAIVFSVGDTLLASYFEPILRAFTNS